MTKRLYFDDAYGTQFEARVVEQTEHLERPALVLDVTYFYPEGGGQPSDRGLLNGRVVLYVQTRPSDKAVLHILDGPIDEGYVYGEIDWARRFDHMQQHTGQHILTQTFAESTQTETVGFHLSSRSLTIDLDRADLTSREIDAVEKRANEVIVENRQISARVYPMNRVPETVRIRMLPDVLPTEGLRVIEIAGFDATSCGGTHVVATGEVGLLKILDVQSHKGGLRVEFVCGGRALQDYINKDQVVTRASALLSAQVSDIPAAIQQLKSDLREKQQRVQRAHQQLAAYMARELIATYPPQGNYRVITLVDPDIDTKLLAIKLVEQPRTIAMLGTSGRKSHIIAACSQDVALNMNQVLRSIFNTLGSGQGGGRPDMAQGGGMDASTEQLDIAFTRAKQEIMRLD